MSRPAPGLIGLDKIDYVSNVRSSQLNQRQSADDDAECGARAVDLDVSESDIANSRNLTKDRTALCGC